ncbi:hypothetical protein QCA50_018496 [Cerrena zonata]|uniref:F-box domain-containing protein n=1 Tax=Cerrena zonata TaxID=2478898 RepID=A0AAW0FM87_9APHY
MDRIMLSSELEEEFLHDVPANVNVDDIPLLLEHNAKVIRELEASIAKHQRAIAFLNGRSNVLLSKINNLLPVEILIDIFMHLVVSWFDSCSPDHERVHYIWTTVCYVCRYWREVAYSSPRLFSYIAIRPFENARYPYLQSETHFVDWIRLSKDIPLHFYISSRSPDRLERIYLWKLLLPHLHRAKSLFLYSPPPITIKPWPPSPFLTSVTLDTENLREDLGGWVVEVLRGAPNLQSFDCSTLSLLQANDWLWMEYPLAPTLTKLRITHTAPYISSGSLDDLLITLNNLPRLRELDLSLLSPGDYPPMDSTMTQNSLRHIPRLRLNGHWQPVFGLLDRVPSVDNISVEITKSQQNRDAEKVRSLPRILVSKLSKETAPYPTIRLSTLRSSPLHYHHNDWRFMLEGWSLHEASDYLTSLKDTEPHFRMSFFLDEVVSDMGDRCATIRSMLDNLQQLISQAGTLLIVTDITDDLSQALIPLWLTVLSCLQTAHSIHVTFAITKRYSPEDIRNITPRLDTFVSEAGGGSDWLPHLRRLRVSVQNDGGSGWFVPQMLPSFRQALYSRWERERGIDILMVDEDVVDAGIDVSMSDIAEVVGELRVV